MNIQITSDRMIDLSDEELKSLNIKTISCYVNMGNESYFDMQNIFPNDIFDFVRRTGKVAKTAAQSMDAYAAFFAEHLTEDNYILHFACSSGISSICENAKKAAELSNGKIFVIDTLSLGNGIALLVKYALELIEVGEDIKTVYEKCLARVPFVQASFLLNTLECLHKGGRCSAIQYFGANLLKIRPTIYMDKTGNMKIREKRRGKFEIAIKSYIKDTFAKYPNPDLKSVYIEESTPNEEIRNLITTEIAKYFTFENMYFNTTSCNSCIHCGENTVAIFYMNDGDKVK